MDKRFSLGGELCLMLSERGEGELEKVEHSQGSLVDEGRVCLRVGKT